MLKIKIWTIFKHYKLIFNCYLLVMKATSIFILAIYWSFIILAPVLAKSINNDYPKSLVLPLKKPLI